MTEHETGTREEWLAARKALLEQEKELTRRSDELAQRQRELPWVEVEEEYAFQTDDGPKTLAEEEDRRNGTGFNFGSPGGAGVNVAHDEELMALSAFALKDGVVYHTYSAYDRGTDVLNPTWQLLDRAPKGRDDGVERQFPGRRDEYPRS